MPAAFTAKLSVQVSDFEDIGLLIQLARLVCDFCSSSQRFACGFLQIPPLDGHPCRPANDSPCRARRRLSLLSKSALPGAPKKKAKGLHLCLSLFDLRIPYRFVFANAVDLRLPPQLKTVSLMARRPNLIASREVGVQMSI